MVEKENRSFIKQVPVTHYSRTPLHTAPSVPVCPNSVSDVRVHSRARAGPRAERRPRRTRFVAIDGDLGWAPTGAAPSSKVGARGRFRGRKGVAQCGRRLRGCRQR